MRVTRNSTKPSAPAIATQIAIGALRYFMLKFTKQSVIAFDFKEALAFEGETGPYAQYAVVRATNIFRKAGWIRRVSVVTQLAPSLRAASIRPTRQAASYKI